MASFFCILISLFILSSCTDVTPSVSLMSKSISKAKVENNQLIFETNYLPRDRDLSITDNNGIIYDLTLVKNEGSKRYYQTNTPGLVVKMAQIYQLAIKNAEAQTVMPIQFELPAGSIVGGGTVSSISSANSYLSVSLATTTPLLTVNVGTTAGTLAAGDDTRITGALQGSDATSANTVNMLVKRDAGGNFAAGTITSTGLVTNTLQITGGSPAVGKVLTSDASGNASWQSSGASQWTTSGSDIYYNSGKVGIGTTTPNFKIDLSGSTLVDRKIGINTKQVIYLPDQTSFLGSLFVGDGGSSLSHISGWEGQKNTGLGIDALGSLTSGYYNTANGYSALSFNSTGNYNTANGVFALKMNSNGFANTASGVYALYSNSSGNYNTASGFYSLYSNTSGFGNVGNGPYSLYFNTTGNTNTANGYQALYNNVAKYGSTAVGYKSMYNADSSATSNPTYNTAIGAFSLQGSVTASANTGTRNTALGYLALQGMTSGSGNIGIGHNSGSAITSGNDNVIIGSNDGASIAATSNSILISDGAGTERVRIDSSGNVGIGTTSPSYKLDVNGDINMVGAGRLRFGGSQVCDAAGCISASDEKLKENIKHLDKSLEKILQIRGVEYDYKDKIKFGEGHHVGVIAQEVEKVYPEVVKTDSKTGLKAVAYDHLVAPLIEAIKELYHRITGLENNQILHEQQIASKADKSEVENLKFENAMNEKEILYLKSKVIKAEKENAELKSRLDRIEKILQTR